MVRMTDIAEKEAAAEVLLQAKGFQEAVVSINGDAVDGMPAAPEIEAATVPYQPEEPVQSEQE